MRSSSRRSAKSDIRDSRANPLESPSAIETSQQTGARHSKSRRTATLYDAVAGRVGLNGFFKDEQIQSSRVRSMAPEEVLLRRVNAPDMIPYDYYNADERLDASQKLPDSDLLKDIHAYVADYYELANTDGHKIDFKSLDETALIAMGILLEEACKEALGENGDMVFSESAAFDQQLPRDEVSQRQVIGSVVPKEVQEYHSSTDDDDDGDDDDVDRMESKPRKRQRRRYGNVNDF